MPAVVSMTDDVTTAAEAMARYRASREKFFPQASASELVNLKMRLEESRRRTVDLENVNKLLKVQVSNLEISLAKAARGEADIPEVLHIADVQRAICTYFQINKERLILSSRTADLVRMRYIGFVLCRELCFQSLPVIGREFGGMDHTSVLNGLKRGAPVWAMVRPNITGKPLLEVVRLMDQAWHAHWKPIELEKYRRLMEERRRAVQDRNGVRSIGEVVA